MVREDSILHFAVFTLVISSIFLFPFLPALIAGIRAAIFEKSFEVNKEIPPLKSLLIGELLAILFVLLAAFFCGEIAPFCGLADPSTLFGTRNAKFEYVWSYMWIAFAAIGVLFGILFLVRAIQCFKAGPKAKAIQLAAFGLSCLIYGVSIPGLLSTLVASIKDSHLL